MICCDIHVKVSFLKHSMAVRKDSGVVEGDYNTTKLVFDFEEDMSNRNIVFQMNNPKGELIFVKELSGNEIILAGEDSSGNACSIFSMEGLHPFELVLYTENGKLTSATGWLPVSKRQTGSNMEGMVVYYAPWFEELETLIDESGVLS